MQFKQHVVSAQTKLIFELRLAPQIRNHKEITRVLLIDFDLEYEELNHEVEVIFEYGLEFFDQHQNEVHHKAISP